MEVTFLGGASAIGASCLAIEIDGKWLVVDAGVRPNDRIDRLPDLAFLDGRDLRAILVTHAHSDHIGALPLLHQHFRNVPIYASIATIRLMEVMLADSVRVMEHRTEQELPLYDADLVRSMLQLVRPLPVGAASSLAELPDVTIHTSRAGHVAGAIMLGIESPAGRLVISGDVSVTPQRTVDGAQVPNLRHPDLFVLESTYGARPHPNRHLEERRLIEAVAAGVERGHVLIPAFALGRAQELLIILRQAQRDKLIPAFTIYVDGLVRTICGAYASFPGALSQRLQRDLGQKQRLFFGKKVLAVATQAERERVLVGPPACIVSSSGMLIGGPSSWYAERLLAQENASIFITGYQDEESPGRALQQLARDGTGKLTINGKAHQVRCQVATYALSAHADGGELASLVRQLKPKAVALVHGDAEARAALAAQIRNDAVVHMPADGDTLEVCPTTMAVPRRVIATKMAPPMPTLPMGIGSGEPITAAALTEIWQACTPGAANYVLHVRELARVWYGSTSADTDESALTALLQDSHQGLFLPLPHTPGLYRVARPSQVTQQPQGSASNSANPPTMVVGKGKDTKRPNQIAILALVDRIFDSPPDLYKRGINPDTGEVTLYFHFPEIAKGVYRAELEALATAGISVTIHPEPHQAQLAAAVRAILPATIHLLKVPAIVQHERTVRVQCSGNLSADVSDQIAAQFQATTGWQLLINGAKSTMPSPSTAAIFRPIGAKRGEINKVQQRAMQEFGPRGCYKVSYDPSQGLLTFRFHFPEVARSMYEAELKEFARQTGWAVQIYPQAHQEALAKAALEALPDGLQVAGTPSITLAKNEVAVVCHGWVDTTLLDTAQRRFKETTGWQLVVQQRG